jgi:hypothetical protein
VDPIKVRSGMMVVTIVLAAAACSSAPPTTQTASDGTYELSVSIPPGGRHAADALEIVATLTYVGPEASIRVDGDDEGLVWFSFKQIDGSLEMGGPLSRLICSPPTTLLRGSAATFSPAKVVAFDEHEPNAAFYERWASDPEVHLPAGRWLIVATAQLWDGETCIGAKPDHVITPAPLLLEVTP